MLQPPSVEIKAHEKFRQVKINPSSGKLKLTVASLRQRVKAPGLDLDLVRGREHGREREEEGALQWIAFRS